MEVIVVGAIILFILVYNNTIDKEKFYADNEKYLELLREEDYTFLCYAKALMRFYGTEEIWIRYLSHGRRSEGTDEMRLVGNLITEKPVHIKLDTTAGELQSDMLTLDAFSGMVNTALFGRGDPNGLPQGLISNDYEKPGPMIHKIVPIENGPVDGNSVYMDEGRLNFRFGRLPQNMSDDGHASWKERFLRELFSEE